MAKAKHLTSWSKMPVALSMTIEFLSLYICAFQNNQYYWGDVKPGNRRKTFWPQVLGKGLLCLEQSGGQVDSCSRNVKCGLTQHVVKENNLDVPTYDEDEIWWYCYVWTV